MFLDYCIQMNGADGWSSLVSRKTLIEATELLENYRAHNPAREFRMVRRMEVVV